jgi:hypothetical protein
MTTQQHNWESLAADRWPNALIHGLGRFALRSERGEVYLYPTESQAKMNAPFHNSRVFDLRECPHAPNCKEIGYSDREERRKYGS